MKEGEASIDDLLVSDKRVFLLQDVMGLHMADPITGEFSLGASGVLYENGKPSKPVRGVTIAGTVSLMLKGVAAVANDFRWRGSTGAPSFLLPSVTIGGA
jgi:PmbA protein